MAARRRLGAGSRGLGRLAAVALATVGALAWTGPTCWAMVGIDPLMRPVAVPGSLSYQIGLSYVPTGGEGVGVEARGRTYRVGWLQSRWGLAAVGTYRLSHRLAVSLEARPALTAESTVKELSGEAPTRTDQQRSELGGAVSVAYRWRPDHPLDPTLILTAEAPAAVEGRLTASWLRDPVVLTGSLGLRRTPGNGRGAVVAAAGASFVANERVHFQTSFAQAIPVGVIDVPATTLYVGAGYALDSVRGDTLSIGISFVVRGGETRAGIELQWAGTVPPVAAAAAVW